MRSSYAVKTNFWLEQAYADHASAVHNLASRIGGRALADDVTQEVFLRYWRQPERFNSQRGSLGAFLMVMTRGVAIDMLRTLNARSAREERSPFLPTPIGSSEHDVIRRTLHGEVAGRVHEALKQLSPEERDAIVTAFYGGLTYREAAVALNTPEGTVKSRIRSGLQRLATDLEAQDLDAFRLDCA